MVQADPPADAANAAAGQPAPRAASGAQAAPVPVKPGQWALPKPAGICAVSGAAIGPGDKFMAGIRETAAGIERIDVLMDHWSQVDQSGLLASWQTVMPRTEEKKKLLVDDEVLCTLFERLADATEPAKMNFRFVLGLILMRKRLVLYDQTRHEEGRDIWVVRMKGRQDTLELVDLKLNAEQTMEVSQQMGQILNEEL